MVKGNSLFGCRVWAQWEDANAPSRFEVFHYVGMAKDAYVFQHARTGALVWKRLGQLREEGFKPFLIEETLLKAA